MVPGSPPAEGFASQIPNPTPAKVSLSHSLAIGKVSLSLRPDSKEFSASVHLVSHRR